MEARLSGVLGLLHVRLVCGLLVHGVAVHVGLLHAGVFVGVDLGDEVGIHGSCCGGFGKLRCCWWIKRWIEDRGKGWGKVDEERVVREGGLVDGVGSGRGRRGVGLASWGAVSGGRVDGAGGGGRVSSLDDDEVNHFGFGAGFGCLIA